MKILSLSGFIPEQICDTVRFTQYRGTGTISHYCGYAADYIAQVLEDESIDGAVYPRSCDSCRTMSSYLSGSGKFTHQLKIPPRRDALAVDYLAAGIERYKLAVEGHYGVRLEDIAERVHLIDQRNKSLAKLYETISHLSYGDYLEAIHTMLEQPLREQAVPSSLPGRIATNKRVYLVGSFLSNTKVATAIENAGMTIVGDNLPESKRRFLLPPVEVTVGGNIYVDIAGSLLSGEMSPTQNDFRQILENDLAEIRQKDVRGVIFVTQTFCEAYDYLFSVYKKMLDDNRLPVLRITQSNSADNRKEEFAIDAFADIL